MIVELTSLLSASYNFTKDWQTLIAALIALAAAVWTIREMRRQSQMDDQRHKDTIRRKKKAARARMPNALSEVCAYARESGLYLTQRRTDLPSAPTRAIITLQEAIEYIDDSAAERVFELVSWYQVQSTRISGNHDITNNSEHYYDATLLHAYANSLFQYARDEVSEVNANSPPQKEMDTAMKNVFGLRYVVSNKEAFIELQDIIARRNT
jgi:hypothetical protein